MTHTRQKYCQNIVEVPMADGSKITRKHWRVLIGIDEEERGLCADCIKLLEKENTMANNAFIQQLRDKPRNLTPKDREGIAQHIEAQVALIYKFQEALKEAKESLGSQPDYHAEGMGCGLEDRNVTDRYEAMEYGWETALERVSEYTVYAIEVIDTALELQPEPSDEEPLNEGGPTTADVVKLVEAFLDNPIESDGDWPEIPAADWTQLHEVVSNIIEAKYQRDCDNDQVVEYVLSNRSKRRMQVIYIPYDAETADDVEQLMMGIEQASGIIEQASRRIQFQMGERRMQEAREAKMEPVLKYLASNGHIAAWKRVKEFVDGGTPNIHVGKNDAVWEPLGLSCEGLTQIVRENIANRKMRENIEDVLLAAVVKMEAN